MAVEDFEIKKSHILMVVVLGVLFGIGQYECNDWKARTAHEAEEAQAIEAAQEAEEDRLEEAQRRREAAEEAQASIDAGSAESAPDAGVAAPDASAE